MSASTKKARYWILTIHTGTNSWKPFTELPKDVQWCRGQKEIGSNTNAEHWQIFVAFSKAVRLSKIKSIFGACHAEPTRSEAAESYVWKDETRIEGSQFEIGQKAIQRNKKEDWNRLRQQAQSGNLEAIAEENPNLYITHYRNLKLIAMDNMAKPNDLTSPSGIWIYGPPGVGKSFFVRQQYGHDLYLKAQNKWWDGYQGQKNVLLDDLDSNILGHYLKIWADQYAFMAECKGSSIQIRPNNFIITSNYKPEDLFHDPVLAAAIRRRFYMIFIPFKRG